MTTQGATATLDGDEISFLRQVFKSTNGQNTGRVSLGDAERCLEQLDFLIEGEMEELIRQVVPAAAKTGKLSFQEVMKVASVAKGQDSAEGDDGQPEGTTLNREDSLAQLEQSFQRQIVSGGVSPMVAVAEGDTSSLRLDRDDSLVQLENSFSNQVMSGDIPDIVAEGEEDAGRSPVIGMDLPKRRTSTNGGLPSPASVPAKWGSYQRDGPEPELVDLPKRRTSVARPGGGSMIGLRAEGPLQDEGDNDTLPASPDFARQTSEAELLDATVNLGVDLVEESDVPHRRASFTLSKSWRNAADEETAKAFGFKQLQAEAEAEAESRREEAARVRTEVETCLTWLSDEAERRFEINEAREEGERRAAAAAAELERVEAARVQAEIEGVVRFVVNSLERDAAIAGAKEEAERRAQEAAETAAAEAAARVKEEAEARAAAEAKAAESAHHAAEALRLVALAQEEAKKKEDAAREAAREAEETAAVERAAFLKAKEEKRAEAEVEARAREEEAGKVAVARAALEEETRVLREKLQEAGEEAAERAEMDAEAQAVQEALEKRHVEDRIKRENELLTEVADIVEREKKVKEEAKKEAQMWKEKLEAMRRERAEEMEAARVRALEEKEKAVAAAVEDARAFESQKALLAAQEASGVDCCRTARDESCGGIMLVPRVLCAVFNLFSSDACADERGVVGYRPDL